MQPVVYLIVAVIAVGILILIAMSLSSKKGYTFDVEEYQTRWLKIENSLVKNDPRTYSLAIIEADKLLEHAMHEMGVPGRTMGENLKKIGNRFTKLNSVWSAHKLRNQIAHERDFEPEYSQAQRALAAFRQALKDLGAI